LEEEEEEDFFFPRDDFALVVADPVFFVPSFALLGFLGSLIAWISVFLFLLPSLLRPGAIGKKIPFSSFSKLDPPWWLEEAEAEHGTEKCPRLEHEGGSG
jgi:hypothetical protein